MLMNSCFLCLAAAALLIASPAATEAKRQVINRKPPWVKKNADWSPDDKKCHKKTCKDTEKCQPQWSMEGCNTKTVYENSECWVCKKMKARKENKMQASADEFKGKAKKTRGAKKSTEASKKSKGKKNKQERKTAKEAGTDKEDKSDEKDKKSGKEDKSNKKDKKSGKGDKSKAVKPTKKPTTTTTSISIDSQDEKKLARLAKKAEAREARQKRKEDAGHEYIFGDIELNKGTKKKKDT